MDYATFKREELPQTATILEAAAGVIRNKDESKDLISRWKLACAENYKAVTDEIAKTEKFTADLLEATRTADFDEGAAILNAVAEDVGIPLTSTDEGVFIWTNGAETAIEADLYGASMKTKLQRFIDETNDRIGKSGRARSIRRALKKRNDALNTVGAYMANEVKIPVTRLNFADLPERLHGGFVRDLLWMVTAPPDAARRVKAKGKGEGEGVES